MNQRPPVNHDTLGTHYASAGKKKLKKILIFHFSVLLALTGFFLSILFFFGSNNSNASDKYDFESYSVDQSYNTMQKASVERVIDGDTIEVGVDGRKHKVRLIGIDTPEVYGGEECFGEEASDFAKNVLSGKEVFLQKDVSEVDRFGRLLRFVYFNKDGNLVDFNALMVGEGFAFSKEYKPDISKAGMLNSLMKEAEKSDRGMWDHCDEY
jgi:endonuclease YncB( thermonuclease family)